MKTKLRNLIILAAVALVIIAAFIILPKLEPKEDEAAAQVTAEPTTDPALLTFADYSAEDIEKLELEANGETLILEYKSDGETVVVKGNEDVEINQTEALNVLYTSAKVVVEQIITEDMTDLAQFGLKEPTIIATATYNDGVTNTFYYGNKVPGSGQYYMMIEGIDKVFAVWNNYGNNAQTTLNDLVEIEAIVLTIEEISELKIAEDNEIKYAFKDESIDGELIDMSSWKLIEPYYRSLESTSEESKWTALFTSVFDLFAEDDVLDSVGDVNEYGLDKPWIEVTVTQINGDVISILISDKIEDGKYAMKFSNSDIIYEIGESNLDFMDYEPIDLVQKLLMLINIRYVEEIKMDGIFGDNVLGVTQTESLDDDGNPRVDSAGGAIMNTGYIVEGVELTEDEVEQGSWFYQTVLSVNILREADEDFAPSKPIGTITLMLTQEPNEYVIEFYEYDDYFYAIKFADSDAYFVANKDDVIEIKDTYELLKERQAEKPY